MRKKLSNRHGQKEEKVKLPYIFIREALENEDSVFQLNFIDKIKRLYTVLEIKSGKAAKKEALRNRKQQDIISGLQITASTFLKDKVYSMLKSKNNFSGKRVVDVQLDPKFDKVKASIVANANYNISIHERPINPNYLKYTDNIPVRLVIERQTEDL